MSSGRSCLLAHSFVSSMNAEKVTPGNCSIPFRKNRENQVSKQNTKGATLHDPVGMEDLISVSVIELEEFDLMVIEVCKRLAYMRW